MMAYSKLIDLVCFTCKVKRATREVFSRESKLHVFQGNHCTVCAKRKVRELNEEAANAKRMG